MKYLDLPVTYLEADEFKENGELNIPDLPKSIPVIVLVQAKWCGHCETAKNAFQEFANKNHAKAIATTIEVDGDRPGEKALATKLQQLFPGFKGFPHYALFIDGKPIQKEIKSRSLQGIEEFAYLG